MLAIWNGLSVAPLTIKNDRASGVVTPHGGRRVYLGTWLDVTVCTIETLQPAHEVKGSAMGYGGICGADQHDHVLRGALEAPSHDARRPREKTAAGQAEL